MPKSKKIPAQYLANQLSLLAGPEPEAGGLDIDTEFREALSRAIPKEMSRWQVVASVSELTGCELTKRTLDDYTAPSHKDHRFPAALLPAFCIVCRDYTPLKVLANHARCAILESEEARFAMIAKLEKEKQNLDKEITKLKSY